MTNALPDYEIKRSAKRRTVSLQVKLGQVRVLAPVGISNNDIHNLVVQKSAWLLRKINEQNSYVKPSSLNFVDGDSLYYLGKLYQLQIIKVSLEENVIQVLCEGSRAEIKSLLQSFYITKANAILPQRLDMAQKLTHLTASQLKIRFYKTRWGSCDSKRRVNLNWLLIMAPLEVIDYVIVHELCHIKHLNHSPQYWHLVSQFVPHYKQLKTWLSKNQTQLYLLCE